MAKPTRESLAIGEVFEEILLLYKQKQGPLAESSHLYNSTFSKIKKGERRLLFDEAIEICRSLDFPIEIFAAMVDAKIYPERKINSLSIYLLKIFIKLKEQGTEINFTTEQIEEVIKKIDDFYSNPKNFPIWKSI